MDSRRLTSAVMVHAGAFVVAVLSLGKSSMHLGHGGPTVSNYTAPQVRSIEVRPLPPIQSIQVRRVDQPEILPLPATPLFDDAITQDSDSGSMLPSGYRP